MLFASKVELHTPHTDIAVSQQIAEWNELGARQQPSYLSSLLPEIRKCLAKPKPRCPTQFQRRAAIFRLGCLGYDIPFSFASHSRHEGDSLRSSIFVLRHAAHPVRHNSISFFPTSCLLAFAIAYVPVLVGHQEIGAIITDKL